MSLAVRPRLCRWRGADANPPDGADYRVEMPERWNGTLLVYSHGYWPAQYPPEGIALSNSPEAETWLLDHGYALAASNFRGVTGYQVGQGYDDQLALLDWFEDTIGRPARTISTAQSMVGAIAVQLAERNPHRFDGVATVCAGYDAQGTFNAGLDGASSTGRARSGPSGRRTGPPASTCGPTSTG